MPPLGGHLHAAGAAGLQGRRGVVQPDVDALHQVAGDLDVVVLEEDDALAELVPLGQVDELPDQLLAGVVLGVGLAGEDDLHRPLGVVEDRGQALGVAAGSGRPACRWRSGGRSRWSGPRGRAPRAACLDPGAVGAAALRAAGAAGRARSRPAARACARGCATARRRGCWSTRSQSVWLVGSSYQRGPEVAVVEAGDLRAQPGAGVDAVGDVGDGDLLRGHARARPAATSCATPGRAAR